MKWITIIPCFVILVIADDVTANQCNLYNFGIQGGAGCAMPWFQQEDLGQTIPVTYKISNMVQNVLTRFNISSEVMLSAIPPPFRTGSPDPMAKVIESMATLEPFLAFLVADVIEAVGFTSDQLQQLGIPGELATRANRVTMIREYFDFSCSDKGMRSLVSCMKSWMNGNCQGQEDNSFIEIWLDRIQDAYCDGTTSSDQVVSEFAAKLGSIREHLQLFGVEIDPSRPGVVEMSPNTPIYQLFDQSFSGGFLKKCSFGLFPSAMNIFSVANQNSTLSAGGALKAIMSYDEIFGKCVLNTMEDDSPQHQQLVEFYKDSWTESVMQRYGVNLAYVKVSDDLATNFKFLGTSTQNVFQFQADVDGERSSTVAYGDPHVVSFDKMEHETCSAEDWQMYLANTFFTVEGFSSLASNALDGTFITQLRIMFSDGEGEMLAQYTANSVEALPTSLMNPSGTELITVERDGDMVKISDQNSKAVFMINKYKDSYNIVVRMADSLYDQSFGLLVTGCLSPLPPFTENASDECQQTCNAVPDEYQRTCLFDCQTTGDIGVGSISTLIENLKEAAEKSDEMVVKEKANKSPESSSPDSSSSESSSPGSSAAFVTMEMSLIVTTLILSVIYL